MDLQPRTWQTWTSPGEFSLKLGGRLSNVTLAYETWGTPGENTLVVLHALSGSSHARSSPQHPQPGWWENFLASGSPLDPARWFIVCANLLGGCYGSTGPGSLDPRTGRRYGPGFPPIAIEDMVLCSPGKSYPQTIAFRSVQREAILADPDWQSGWYDERRYPARGLALARKIGIITYRSDAEFQQRFERQVDDPRPHFLEGKFKVQSYLDHHGEKFVRRFDANSYLYYSRAMDLYDLGEGLGSLAEGVRRIRARTIFFAFETDFLCPRYQVEELHQALAAAGRDSRFALIPTIHGHDAFLIEIEEIHKELATFLGS